MESTNGDHSTLEDGIPCFAVLDPKSHWWVLAAEETEDLASLPQPVLAVVPDLGAVPILSEEWIREHADDVVCQTAAKAVGSERTRFGTREDGVLVLVAPLEGSMQIAVTAALRRHILQMNLEPATSMSM